MEQKYPGEKTLYVDVNSFAIDIRKVPKSWNIRFWSVNRHNFRSYHAWFDSRQNRPYIQWSSGYQLISQHDFDDYSSSRNRNGTY